MQPHTSHISQPFFLQGGGKMGAFMRAFAWETSDYGIPAQWPAALRTTVSIMLRSQLPMVMFRGADCLCLYNDAFLKLINSDMHPASFTAPAHRIFKSAWQDVGEVITSFFSKNVQTDREIVRLPFVQPDTQAACFHAFEFTPVLDDDGSTLALLGICTDALERIHSNPQTGKSKNNFRDIMLHAPVGICLVNADSSKVELVNDVFLEIAGKKREALDSKFFWDAMAETKQDFFPIFQEVVKTGRPYRGNETKVTLLRNGKPEEIYVNFVYEPMRDDEDRVNAVMMVGIDLTGQVQVRKKLEESENRFSMMIHQSPIAIGLTRGKDLVTDSINQPMLELLGKSKDIIGKTMLEATPELEGKESYRRMQEVFATGIPFHAKEIPEYFNSLEGDVHYFNLSCTPVFDGEKVIATLQVAIDVTSEVIAKKKIREAEAKARLAIESADLGTYEVDLITNELKASKRFQSIWGLPGNLSRAAFEARIHPDDHAVRQQAFKEAYITGNLFYEARITIPGSGERWLRTHGKMFFDKKICRLT